MTDATRAEYMTAARKALATAANRAETLFADGYSIEPYEDRPGVYWVARGENDTRPLQPGETLWNDVDVVNQDCTCASFRWRGACKHLMATNKAVANAARLLGPMIPRSAVASMLAPPHVPPQMDETPKPPRTRLSESQWKDRIAADFG